MTVEIHSQESYLTPWLIPKMEVAYKKKAR